MSERLPVPLRDWILVRREKVGSGLILPESSADAWQYFAVDTGPDVDGVEAGDGLVFQPQRVLSGHVPVAANHVLVQSSAVIGVHPKESE